MRDQIRIAGDLVLSSGPVTASVHRATRRQLRVLAYHGVDDRSAFDWQMAYVRRFYNPVSADEVVAALDGEHRLPDFAVWVTFDDGLPSVMDNALPILEANGIKATMFVCPGVIGTKEPLWWQLIEICDGDKIRLGANNDITSGQLTEHLKSVDDAVRVAEMYRLRGEYRRAFGRNPEQRQLTVEELQQLTSRGHTIGNHTLTHPLLDRCSQSEQRLQIADAHQWLASNLGVAPQLFSYPNGNSTATAEQCLRDLGYALALLFDHRLAAIPLQPFSVSRLRVDDANSPERYTAILAGAHPLLSIVRPSRRVTRRT